MAVAVASLCLSDEAFLSKFQHCELPLSMFRHGDHLRFAWLTLHRYKFNAALEIIREGIRRFASHHGAANIYHETITTAWVHLLTSHSEDTFEEFVAKHEDRLNRELLHRFWTPSILDSATARERWVPPDKEWLPASKKGLSN